MTAPAVTSTSTTPIPPQSDPNDPSVPHPAYERMRPRWEKCRALMAGTEAIRAGEDTYLPRLEAETQDSYDVRLNIAALFPGFSRVVKAAVGMLLQQEPVLGEDMPKPLVDLWENVDAAGTHGAVFARELVQNAMIDGFDGIFVDYSRVDNPAKIDSDAEKRLGLRPYWILFKVDDVIKPIYQTVNGVRTLVLLILREVVDEIVPPFGLKTVTRYRIYTNTKGVVQHQLWTVPDGGGKPTITEQPAAMQKMTRIPWSPLRAGEKISEVETKPPLLDLADLNIEHHQTKTNMLNLELLACVPTQVRIGAEKDPETGEYPPIVLGPRSTIEAPKLEGVAQPVYWHAPPTDVLEPVRNTLNATEAAMGAAGMAFLTPETRAAETAEAKRIDASAQSATLSTVGRALQDCLELAFDFTAEYLGIEAGSVTINRDFENQVLDSSTMLAYVQAVRDAGLPIRILLEAWQQGGRLPEGTDIEELEQEMLANMAAEEDRKRLESAADPSNPDIAPEGGKKPKEFSVDFGDGRRARIKQEA